MKLLLGFLAVCTLSCLVALGGVPANPDTKGPKQRIEEALESTRKLILNAHMKLGKGISGVASGQEKIEDPTPAQRCCRTNLTRIDRDIKKILIAIDELQACYQQESNSQGELTLAIFGERLTSLTNTLTLFERARKPDEVSGTVQGSKRAFRNMKLEFDNLPECPLEDTSQ